MKAVTESAPDQDDLNPLGQAVRAALDRMLSHPEFGASERRRTFLRFVVEEVLAGRGPSLKGFTIAQEVFGRDDSFDPKTDPVVRLEARRLRQDLDTYYVGPGADDAVRISIPKGGYVPHFEVRQRPVSTPVSPSVPEQDHSAHLLSERPRVLGRTVLWIGSALAVTAAIALASLWIFRTEPVVTTDRPLADLPRITILPFEALDSSATTRALSLGLSSALILKLASFDNLRLFAPPVSNDANALVADFRSDGVPTYVVFSTVQTEGENAMVNVQLKSVGSGELVWGEIYKLHLNPEELFGLSESVSTEIATAIGQPYGPLNDNIQARTGANPPESLESYLCVMQAHAYRRGFSSDAFEPVKDCLEATVKRSPDYVEAWAMLGWLHMDAARYLFVPPDAVDAEYATALEMAEHAYRLAPENVLAVKALSSIHHHIGNHGESERLGRIALELNPYDPDTLAQVGWRLSVREKYEEGGGLMEQAIQRTVDPPGWYHFVLSLHQFMQGNPEQALTEAEIAGTKGTGYGWFLVAVNAAALGDIEKTAKALENLLYYPDVALDPENYMRRHRVAENIITKTMAEYRKGQRLVSGSLDSKMITKQ